MASEPKTQKIAGRNYTLIFECEDFEGTKWLDTKVFLNGQYLITIAGVDVPLFQRAFEGLLNTFQI